MENPIYIGLSRQAQLRREMTMVANNIANMDTTAFKREMNINQSYDERIRFGERLAFVLDVGSALDFQEGGVNLTGNDLDVAIRGPGFFMVDDGAAVKFTRNGAFTMDEQSRLVTKQGYLVLDENQGPIVLPGNGAGITISEEGIIRADDEEIGRLGVVEFANPQELKRARDSLYTSEEEPQAAEDSRFMQGALEKSNVNPIAEMTEMIGVHRAYDSVKKLLDQENERQKAIAQRLARPLQSGA